MARQLQYGPDRRPAYLAALLALAAALVAGLGEQPRAAPASLDQGLAAFTSYAVEQIDSALAGAERLKARLAAGDAAGAQRAWLEARAGWERAETFTGELYPDLDEAIDAWPDAHRGFHAFEARLFAGETRGYDAAVDALVAKLREFHERIRAKGVTAQGLLNGSAKLAFEVGEKKGAGGESAASGSSLDDMRHNLEGLEKAYLSVFQPALKSADPMLEDLASTQLHRLRALVARAPDLKSLDQELVETLTERLAINLQNAAPKLGLETPSLAD